MRKTKLLQMHNVSIVVDDLKAAIAFFAEPISAKKIVTRGREIGSDGQVVAPKVSVTRNAH